MSVQLKTMRRISGPPLETEFQRRVLKKLRAIPNSYWVKTHDLCTSGVLDILGCINGHFVSLELKRSATHKASPLQLYTVDKINKSGGIAFVVYPENFEDALKEILERTKETKNLKTTARIK